MKFKEEEQNNLDLKSTFFYLNQPTQAETMKENQILFSKYISEIVERTIIEFNNSRNWQFLSLKGNDFKEFIFFLKKFFFILSSKYFKHLGCSKNNHEFNHDFYKTQMEQLLRIRVEIGLVRHSKHNWKKFFTKISFLKNYDNELVFHNFYLKLIGEEMNQKPIDDIGAIEKNFSFKKNTIKTMCGRSY